MVVYSYLLYPGLIWVFARVFGRPPQAPAIGAELPTATLLIAAHNEEAVIAQRLRNALAMDYPHGHLQIVVASDGSSDGTAGVVDSFADRGVRLLDYNIRRGKSAVLNAAMTQIDTELVILSDANTQIERDAARNLARWFSDPRVGAVCGRLVLTDPATGKNADGLYWRYETFLKKCEARLGALLGSNGSIYAIRRQLYVPIPPNTIVDDFVIPLLAKLRTNFRIVYDCDAVASEETAADIRGEFQRRARIGAGGFQAIALLWRLMSPARGWLAFAFVSHKVMRWLCPLALLAMLVSSTAAAFTAPAYRLALIAQILFYLASLAAALLPRARSLRPLKLATMFTSMNAALAVGFCRWVGGVRSGAWERTARAVEVAAEPGS